MSDTPTGDIMSDLDNLDLSTVKSGFPILPEGLVNVTVLEIKTEPNKAGTGQNLKLKLGLVDPATDVDGKAVNPGFPIFDLISLTPTEKYDPRPRLADFKEAALGTKAGPFNPIEQYLGVTLTVRLKIDRNEQYGTKNVVARYVKKG